MRSPSRFLRADDGDERLHVRQLVDLARCGIGFGMRDVMPDANAERFLLSDDARLETLPTQTRCQSVGLIFSVVGRNLHGVFANRPAVSRRTGLTVTRGNGDGDTRIDAAARPRGKIKLIA